MPLLFQRSIGSENRAFTPSAIRKLLISALAATGLTDAAGDPLMFSPHDFRRIFVTDAIMSGLPPHIAQVICGHKNIGTTIGYKAVYPAEAIEAHRAFIARRRANLHDRIAEAEREGWPGEIEGLKVSLAGTEDKLAQIDTALHRQEQAVHLGMPAFPDIAGRCVPPAPEGTP